MKSVAVFGWFGQGNIGDDLLLLGLKELFNGWNVLPMSNDGHGRYPRLNVDKVNECDLFVLAAGENSVNADTVFKPEPHMPHLAYKAYAHTGFWRKPWLHKIHVPKIALGCGVNVDCREEIGLNVVKDLAEFSYIGLRDSTAFNILNSFGVLQGKLGLFYDLVFALSLNVYSWRGSKDLAVVVPTDREHLGMVEKSRGWLCERLKGYKRCVFLPFGSKDNDDSQTCVSLLSCASKGVVLPHFGLSLMKILRLLCDCQKVFSYRLHGLLLAFLVGAPFEFYPYHRKLQRVYDTVNGVDVEVIRERQKRQFEAALEMVN